MLRSSILDHNLDKDEYSDSELGKYENTISQELRDNLEHYALSVQTDARDKRITQRIII